MWNCTFCTTDLSMLHIYKREYNPKTEVSMDLISDKTVSFDICTIILIGFCYIIIIYIEEFVITQFKW